jgi:hypothetical protein
MSRIPAFPWKLLVAGGVAWLLYLLLGLAGWSTFSSDTAGHRFQVDFLQLLLFGGWALVIVGLGGWMLGERERDRVDEQARQHMERQLGNQAPPTRGPEGAVGG